MKTFIHVLSHLVFWVWNLTFISVMYLWCLPEVGLELFQAARSGQIDPTFIASFLALMIVPVVCTLLGFFRLRTYPVLLARLFYGVEAPLFTLCLLRLFLLRELTVASGFTLGLGIVAIAMFGIELLSGYSAYRPRLALAQLIAHSIILLVGLYAGSLLLLYTLPLVFILGRNFVTGFFQLLWISDLKWMLNYPLELVFSFLSFASLLIFFSMPYALVNFYLQAWVRIRTAFGKQHSEQKSWIVTGTTIAISGLLFIGLQAQPQVKAFDLLMTPESIARAQAGEPVELVGDRQIQLENADILEAGLTNAYLHRYRYLSPWSQSNALADLYNRAFNLPKANVQWLQNIHNGLISPFLYRGENSDIQTAETLYAQFFDAPIQKAEISAVRSALQSTANRDETKAGLLNLDQKVVRLASQEVTVDERGDWATIEIHEQYENPTIEDQEIFYTFSLPESAAISGLWLGDAANPKLFPSVVSPRGAAQQVYNGEVERAKFQQATDPALLEQVGPRQYRLRVFPIPAAEFPTQTDAEGRVTRLMDRVPGELHLVMTYQVMQQAGKWPLPQLTEKRNIFWTDETTHLREDRPVALTADEWFEAALPAKRAKPKAQAISLEEGVSITATPVAKKDKHFLAEKKLAIVVDSSYSMAEHSTALQEAISELNAIANKNTLDFYITAAGKEAVTTKAVETNQIEFYGSLQPADMLQQFSALRGSRAYDAVLLLTDEGSYELSKHQAELPNTGAPLWMVHVDGKVPSAYEDGLLQKLQASKGGVETSVALALERIALGWADATAVDGYVWRVETSAENSAGKETGGGKPAGFEAIAAKQLIYQQSRTLDMTEVAALDEVHAIAKRTGIVTPYSSMLVLVDERQRELLRAAEAGEDRFEREVEDGQDDLTQPGNALAASVPEPGQVLSIAGCAIALVFLKRSSKDAKRYR